MQSGDPLLLITYSIKDPAKKGWTATITFDNAEGKNQKLNLSGTGSKSATETMYGLTDPGTDKPNCRITVTAKG